jgi:hypothetical protein
MRGFVAGSLGLALALGGGTAAAEETPPARPPYYELYPDYLPYRTGDPIPAGYSVEKNNTRTLGIVGGSVALGVFYTWGILAVRSSSNGATWMFLPVVGPSALILTHSKHCDPRCAGMEQGAVIVNAVGQAAGAALFIWGISSWRTRLVRQDLNQPQAFVTPMLMGSGYGVGAVGSF